VNDEQANEALARFFAWGDELRRRAEADPTPETVAALQDYVERQRAILAIAESVTPN
jgi:hypothetical protein